MNKVAQNFLQTKIINTISTKYNGNFDVFINNNQNINTFIKNSNLETVITHMKFNITNDDYIKIIKIINNEIDFSKYQQNNNPNNINLQEQTNKIEIDKPKVKRKIINQKNIEGFVDTLILAFITTSFIGIILLNIYSKIAHT